MQTEWEYYEWCETNTNNEGLSLRLCMERYGVGGWISKDQDMVAALIFLSADRDFGKSWLLGVKHLDGQQASIRVYENMPTYKLSLNTSLGTKISRLLTESVFKEV